MTRRRQKVPIFVSIFLPEELISFVGLTVVIPNLPGKLKFLLFLKKKYFEKLPSDIVQRKSGFSSLIHLR